MRIFVVCFLLLTSFAISAHESRSDIITVRGQGSIFQAPDILKFTIAVEEKGDNSAALNDLVSSKTQKILSVLTKHKIAEQDIQAMSLSLYPWYERERQSNIQKGYVFNRNINVTLRNFKNYPAILDDLFALKVSRIDGFRYEVEDQQQAYLNALEAAIADGHERAKHLAKNLQIRLGSVVNVEETSSYQPAPQPSARSLSVFNEAAQYLPGLNEINASVTLSFSIAK
ncbi:MULTISPECIES: SIMPL domain-containing protein [Alteromonadaceae]|uniref:SIMPL domain-containing protein n=1 Tax=Alteromonadaceae TaxID=72275 RepID=UPI001C0A1260|nr:MULTISPECIES: SIMPL domain-containing protein [Aliiglaciecola]MBU2876292.1 SIMPL domain-containing protein [Aliiglaciecola lipolytica]MDO6710508.1 SIMPL domain-containing protein [Aliiglaciecola sp. 2_MG-2023]MDO6751627.1 SIMPL domain-containing protein [Aliiglaciecola sp. 1_MG-2023]